MKFDFASLLVRCCNVVGGTTLDQRMTRWLRRDDLLEGNGWNTAECIKPG